MLKILYILTTGATLGLLIFEAPSGRLLSTTPEKAQVNAGPSGKTVRGRGPTFIYLGGGYQGGK